MKSVDPFDIFQQRHFKRCVPFFHRLKEDLEKCMGMFTWGLTVLRKPLVVWTMKGGEHLSLCLTTFSRTKKSRR